MSEVLDVPIAELSAADSPRLHGEVAEHVRQLIDTGIDPPPIVVHRPTMRVIDGMHRLRAAQVVGRTVIAARFFDGTEADAFTLAVELNAEHGLPLSSSDRTAAAARVMQSHPGWSDRRIAALTRLSPRTVRAVRQRTTDPHAQPSARIGRDGRARPVDIADQRRRAAALLRDDAGASLRSVARETGISVNTVKDVAQRLENGLDPVPDGRPAPAAGARKPVCAAPSLPAAVPSAPAPARPGSGPATARPTARVAAGPRPAVDGPAQRSPEFGELLEQLCRDPSMRSNEFVRSMLRLVRMQALVTDPPAPAEHQIPTHCVPAMAQVARTCAQAWTQLGADLERAASSR